MKFKNKIFYLPLGIVLTFLAIGVSFANEPTISNKQEKKFESEQPGGNLNVNSENIEEKRKRNNRFNDLFYDDNSTRDSPNGNSSINPSGNGTRTNSFLKCPEEEFAATPIAPIGAGAIVKETYPSFSYRLPQTTSYPLWFSITNKNLIEPLFVTEIKDLRAGILEIKTPSNVKLEENTYYVATLMVSCSEKRPSLNYYTRYPFLYSPSSK